MRAEYVPPTLQYTVKDDHKEAVDGKYDYNGDSDYDADYLSDNLGEWKPIIDSFNSPNPFKKWELLMMIFTMAPAIIHTLYFASLSANLAVLFARISIFTFSVLLVGCLIYLNTWTNEDSISGMVAQRNLKPSYITILLILGVSYFVVGMFLISLVVITSKTDNKFITTSFFFGLISPIFSSAILIFPLVVFKDLKDTCSIPIGKRRVKGKYRIKFYKSLNTEQHKKAHYFVILTGVGLGWVSLILSLLGNGMIDYNSYMSLFYLLFSVSGIVIFMTYERCLKPKKKEGQIILRKPQKWIPKMLKLRIPQKWIPKMLKKDTWLKRLSIFFEFTGLYYYLASLCMVLVLNYKLIEIR